MAKKKPFNVMQFEPTEHYTAADKTKFANWLADFILSGFPQSKFYQWAYQRLSNCFGHIAHYNQGGFFTTWFDTPDDCQRWLDHVRNYTPLGQPSYTYVDVEREIKSWLSCPEVAAKVEAMMREKEWCLEVDSVVVNDNNDDEGSVRLGWTRQEKANCDEPTDDEVEQWKRGKLKLYDAFFQFWIEKREARQLQLADLDGTFSDRLAEWREEEYERTFNDVARLEAVVDAATKAVENAPEELQRHMQALILLIIRA